MLPVKKNDQAFKELDDYAKSKNKTLKEALSSDEHLDDVSNIFYKHMPLTVRMVMNKEKFKNMYKSKREIFVNMIAV